MAKHILFISSWYPNRNNTTHGIFNRYFAEAVSLYNTVSVLHVCSDPSLQTDFELVTENENNIRTATVYYRKIESNIPVLSALQKRKKVLHAFKLGYNSLFAGNKKPDLIHLNVVMPLGIGVIFLSKKYDIPFVVNENWSGYTTDDGNYKGPILKKMTQSIISKARAILPTSSWLKNAMLDHGLNGNYHVIPNVVDTNRFKLAHSGNQRNDVRFLHISSLNDREKNVSGIIRAFAAALKQNPAMTLTIVGKGIDEPVYKKMVEQSRISDHIHFTGKLIKDELVNQIQTSDALIMFSNYETFSLVNIEAFACGKPVITSNAGAIPEYMRPELGYMVAKGDEQALTKAILSFCENKSRFDPVYIREFAVAHFSYQKVGKDLDAIYNQVLN